MSKKLGMIWLFCPRRYHYRYHYRYIISIKKYQVRKIVIQIRKTNFYVGCEMTIFPLKHNTMINGFLFCPRRYYYLYYKICFILSVQINNILIKLPLQVDLRKRLFRLAEEAFQSVGEETRQPGK